MIEFYWVKVVPRAGVEPARPYGQRTLSPLFYSYANAVPSVIIEKIWCRGRESNPHDLTDNGF